MNTIRQLECAIVKGNIKKASAITRKCLLEGLSPQAIIANGTLKGLDAVGINPYYQSHLFRKEMGTSFVEYLTSVRLSVAKSLLRQNVLSMMEICLEVGYQDPGHFAKVFKRKEGAHPTEYRKRILEATA